MSALAVDTPPRGDSRLPGVRLALARGLLARGFTSPALACLRTAAQGGGRRAAEAALLLARQLLSQGQFAEARAAFDRALADGSALAGDADAWRDAAACCLALGEAAAAIQHAQRSLTLRPDDAATLAIGLDALYRQGRMNEAQAIAQQAVEQQPDAAALRLRLGTLLMHNGRTREAVPHYERALALDPDCHEARAALGLSSGEPGAIAQATAHFEAVAALQGETAHALAWLALARAANIELLAAEDASHRLLALQPDHLAGLFTLAVCRGQRADVAGSAAMLDRIQAVKPEMFSATSNRAYLATCTPDIDRDTVFERHADWERRHGADFPPLPPVDLGREDPGRRLRIGYVSGDLAQHPVGILLREVLRHRDRAAFEVHAFSTVRVPDATTEELRADCDAWHEVLALDHAETARRIRAAGIDILVDLSGHTAYHRLGAFHMRPAPVQVSWIGYFHSTGLKAIDYYITDPRTTPPDDGQRFAETPVYLPHTRWCWAPPDYAPAVVARPAGEGGAPEGGIVFGSFNRVEKLVDPVVAAWARIVLAVPGSRLLLKSRSLAEGESAQLLRQRFEACGLPAERLELRGATPHHAMLAEYGDIDIALDPFPFCGGLTTLESLWMGVPVVTLCGHSVVSRQSHAVLDTLGCAPGLSFESLADYEAGAVALAHDAPRRAQLRESLRPRMAASALCRPAEFTREVESLYRRMWAAACAGGRLPALAASLS